jgi:hypothetical protein
MIMLRPSFTWLANWSITEEVRSTTKSSLEVLVRSQEPEGRGENKAVASKSAAPRD